MNFNLASMLSEVPAGRVFGLDQQMFISIAIQLFNTGVLAVALGFILYRPVQKFMRERSERIKKQFSDASEKMAKSDMLRAEYEKKLKQIDIEREKILEAAKADAVERSKQILEEAKAEAASIKKRTEESILHEKERLKEETETYIIELASLMAEKFIKQSIDSETQEKLFNEAMAQLEESTWTH
ncbi:MAG: ATP synthase F0 subunit B [Eubacteriales bacterium]|nr:ATP synthase F0 subunit B [Eubacteriales bacterium]